MTAIGSASITFIAKALSRLAVRDRGGIGESGREGRLGFLLVGAIGDLLLVARVLQDGRRELGSRWNEVEGRRRREGWIYRDCLGFSASFQINLNGSTGGMLTQCSRSMDQPGSHKWWIGRPYQF
jgi:hypothetical protein